MSSVRALMPGAPKLCLSGPVTNGPATIVRTEAGFNVATISAAHGATPLRVPGVRKGDPFRDA